MSRAATTRLAYLRDRASMMAQVRRFFETREVLEVDCPACVVFPSLDAYIDPIYVVGCEGERRYLHTSPEYAMKRLLAEGLGDLYQLGHVFRDSEVGKSHNPEFMMIEWYRTSYLLEALIEETAELIRLFLGQLPLYTTSYRELLQRYAGVDYVQASPEELKASLERAGFTAAEGLSSDRDNLLNQLMGLLVEPQLGKECLQVVINYPSSQSALAELGLERETPVAKRFEIYHEGKELCNGYQELRDGAELRTRFVKANLLRSTHGKDSLPLDERLLGALEKMPPCCGVAVGFDRLMMLRHGVESIESILPFAWDHA